MTPLKAFLLALIVGAAIPLGFAWKDRRASEATDAAADRLAPKFQTLAPGVFVAAQISPEELYRFRHQASVVSLIDLRPDGESADQTPAADMEAEAKRQDMRFSYVPTPHGPIPDALVQQFSQAMTQSPQPFLLYCRSGSRAARVWALAEASRPGGQQAPAILAAVRGAGLSADDLGDEIGRRIAARSSAKPQ